MKTVALRSPMALAAAFLAAGCSMSAAMTEATSARPCPVGRPDPTRPSSAGPVSWFVPAGEGDRATLNTWCRTVGQPVVEGVPQPSAAEWERGGLTVAAWNMWMGGGDVEAFLEHELGFRCGSPPASVDPFVLLLQEVYRRSTTLPDPVPTSAIPFLIDPERPTNPLDIAEVAEHCGLSLVYVPSARNGDRVVEGVAEDKGNAILANVRLTNPIAVEVPFEAGRKVAVGATVDGPAGPLRVVSVHLDVASTLLRTFVTGYGTRVRQAEGLANGLDLADPIVATVVGGDYNTWSERETALLRFLARYPDSPELDPTPSRGFLPTDHIFFRTGPEGRLTVLPESYRLVGPRYGSDHHARILEITIGPANVP